MEAPQGLLIRLTANFPDHTYTDHSDFRDVALNSVLDVLKTTNAELIYACQLDSNEQPGVVDKGKAVFIVRLSIRKSRIWAKTGLDDKQEILNLFVHNFEQRSHSNGIRQMISKEGSDVIDFEVEWNQFLIKHG
ncbi:hypothetical protein [Flavobacterium silvaticum]|uniref:Uncharacterized protein n=1 Tax=Flavobacterium silvaticum TaxID=1852020 RepID=A0A972FVP7_9FLAO|nr:hypothetical protein [Flavobacterium silvaticum]NMH28897.1 hypothetical protein [Flavobacterium silvaticum]